MSKCLRIEGVEQGVLEIIGIKVGVEVDEPRLEGSR
jgi:hypothetical protein